MKGREMQGRGARMRIFPLTFVLASILVAFGRGAAEAHALHTTLTQLEYVPADGTVRVSIRVFADDFGRAVAGQRMPGPAAGHAAVDPTLRYVGASFGLAGGDGRPVALRWCGVRRTGDLLWLCMRGAAPAGLRGGSVRNVMLFGLFDDQVNIVQAAYGGVRQSLLFVPGDGAKRLP